MRNKHNFYNQYRKKRASPYFLVLVAPIKMIKKKLIKHNTEELNKFILFYNSVCIAGDGIKFNNHKNE